MVKVVTPLGTVNVELPGVENVCEEGVAPTGDVPTTIKPATARAATVTAASTRWNPEDRNMEVTSLTFEADLNSSTESRRG